MDNVLSTPLRCQRTTSKGFPRKYWKLVLAFVVSGCALLLAACNRADAVNSLILEESLTLRGHNGAVHSVVFTPDGESIVSGAEDRMVKVWDATSALEKSSFQGHTDVVSTIAVSPDGMTIAAGSWDTTVALWDMGTAKEVGRLRGHRKRIRAVVFARSGKVLASAGDEGTVRVWDVTSCEERAVFEHSVTRFETAVIGSLPVNALAIDREGMTLASGGPSTGGVTVAGEIKVWYVATGVQKATYKVPGNVRALAFSQVGNMLAVGYGNNPRSPGGVIVFEGDTGRRLLALGGQELPVFAVQFTPDCKSVAGGSGDQTVKLWEVANGREVGSINAESGPVYSVSVSPAGGLLATGGANGTVKLWRISGVGRR